MRNTVQRNIILNIISNSSSHLTAMDIYLKCKITLPKISLGTVYRNLAYLFDKGYISKIKMPDNIDRYDRKNIHAHVICKSCGSIVDINKDFIKNMPMISDYKIIDYDLCFNGICYKCLEKEKKHGIKRL